MTDLHDLTELAPVLLDEARAASDGRASRKLTGGAGQPLHQLLLALDGGRELSEHSNPGQATLQVLQGVVTLRASGEVTVGAGRLATIPDEPHSVHAVEPSVVLLTLVHRVP